MGFGGPLDTPLFPLCLSPGPRACHGDVRSSGAQAPCRSTGRSARRARHRRDRASEEEQLRGFAPASTSHNSPPFGHRSLSATSAQAGSHPPPGQSPGAPQSINASRQDASVAARYGCAPADPADPLDFTTAAAPDSVSPRMGSFWLLGRGPEPPGDRAVRATRGRRHFRDPRSLHHTKRGRCLFLQTLADCQAPSKQQPASRLPTANGGRRRPRSHDRGRSLNRAVGVFYGKV
ncbi:hypothetical protein NDU88_001074 [Pleurodeles waltl]|uniref:Uncharacterized protein n=1 Tax=Pleurodeles waltl TaxID=8319 RepID=A0AAV7R8N8_PLEWA|nr:hypothetical protein NDU88_001074 [Pleurodeles waltl]